MSDKNQAVRRRPGLKHGVTVCGVKTEVLDQSHYGAVMGE